MIRLIRLGWWTKGFEKWPQMQKILPEPHLKRFMGWYKLTPSLARYQWIKSSNIRLWKQGFLMKILQTRRQFFHGHVYSQQPQLVHGSPQCWGEIEAEVVPTDSTPSRPWFNAIMALMLTIMALMLTSFEVQDIQLLLAVVLIVRSAKRVNMC